MTGSGELSHVRRIFVRAPNWVGDFVMATAAFERLRRAFPQAHIAIGGRPFLQPLCNGSAWCDEFVPMPRAGGIRGLFAQIGAVRRGRFDLAVVLPNSLETGLVPFLARVPIRLGYRQGRPLLMNRGLTVKAQRRLWEKRLGPRRKPVPMPRYYRELLDVLRLPGSDLHPQLRVTSEESLWVDADLKARGIGPDERLVLIVVGANFGASKLWLPERFGAVARHFANAGYRPLVTVGPSEVELGNRIAEVGGVQALVDPVLPLDKLKALVARCSLMITGDTGPRHLAVAFDRPVVCLMGPTDKNYTDYCTEQTELIQKDLPCVPCQRKVCPLGHHQCMRDIGVDEVIAAGERLLARAAAGVNPGTPRRSS
ncbi:MAG: lipopolysaccharide heptosyltransferase II [Planctomycetota bacterium]